MLMRIHEHLLDFFVTLFALSSLALWGIILSGGTFNAYAVLVLLVPLVSAYLVFINSRGHIPPAPEKTAPEHNANRFEIETIVLFVLLLLIFFSKSELGNGCSAVGRIVSIPETDNGTTMAFHLMFRSGKIAIHTWRRVAYRHFLHAGFTSTRSGRRGLPVFWTAAPGPTHAGDQSRAVLRHGQDAGQLPGHRSGGFILDRDQLPAGVLPRCACPGGHVDRTCLLRAVSADRR